MPAAEMMIGTIIGEIRIAMATRRKGMYERLRPSAASVPRMVAREVAKTAIMMLFFADCSHCRLSMMSWYQRSE